MYKRWKIAQEAEIEYLKRHATTFYHTEDMRKKPLEFMCKCTSLTEDKLNDSRIVEIGGGQLALTFSNLDDTSKIIIDPILIFNEATNVRYNKVRGVGEYLPFRDNSIDICWSMNVIDHVMSPSEMLREIQRVLHSNGMLVISCHVFPNYLKCFIPLLDRFDKPHPYHFTEASLYNLLAQYFEVTRLFELEHQQLKCNQSLKENIAGIIKVRRVFYRCIPK